MEKKHVLCALIHNYFNRLNFYHLDSSPVSINNITSRYIDNLTAKLTIGDAKNVYFQTSSELSMKNAIPFSHHNLYQISRCFRNKEKTRMHNPSFSMLEWYRSKSMLGEVINDAINIIQKFYNILIEESSNYKIELKLLDMSKGFSKYLLRDLWIKYANIDLSIILEQLYLGDSQCLMRTATKLGLNVPPASSFDDIFSLIMSDVIAQKINTQNCIIFGWPSIQSLCSRNQSLNDLFSERFEIYINGIEIGNGCNEITLPATQKAKISNTSILHGQTLVNLPNTKNISGVALGIDRLIISCLNLSDIRSFESKLEF